ncbi:MAG: B-box zinc finger protein, partial [Verrucomicrobiota bacterium]
MNIKILCSCGTKFSFEVEPVEGRMPVPIVCPQCGANVTDAANEIAAQTASTVAPPEVVASEKPRMRLQVVLPPKAQMQDASAAFDATAGPVEMCPRHSRQPAIEHCVVCGKPICAECMQAFGFLCSVTCRYRAEQEGISIPTFKG